MLYVGKGPKEEDPNGKEEEARNEEEEREKCLELCFKVFRGRDGAVWLELSGLCISKVCLVGLLWSSRCPNGCLKFRWIFPCPEFVFDYCHKGGDGPPFIPLPLAFLALANSGTICHLFRNWQLRQC